MEGVALPKSAILIESGGSNGDGRFSGEGKFNVEDGISTGCATVLVSIRGIGGEGICVDIDVGEQGVGGGVEGEATDVASGRKVDIGGGDVRAGREDVAGGRGIAGGEGEGEELLSVRGSDVRRGAVWESSEGPTLGLNIRGVLSLSPTTPEKGGWGPAGSSDDEGLVSASGAVYIVPVGDGRAVVAVFDELADFVVLELGVPLPGWVTVKYSPRSS